MLDRDTLKLVDLSKVKLKVEMNPNVVLLALLEVIDGAWAFTIAVLVIGGEGEGLQRRIELTRCRRENLGNNCHPLSLVSHIISNSNGNIKRVVDLREKEACAEDRKLGRRCERSLPPSSFLRSCEALWSIAARAERCFQERELSWKAKIFLGSESQSLSLMERSRQSKARGPTEEAEGVSTLCLGDGQEGLRLEGCSHCRSQAQSPGLSVGFNPSYELFRLSFAFIGQSFKVPQINPSGVSSPVRSLSVESGPAYWNTRGLGSKKKRRVVKDCLCHENPNVVMLQETKRESCDRRLDRFLYSNEWERGFLQSIQEALLKLTSDHCPIVLDTNPFVWGPTPFRFENMWLMYFDFKDNLGCWWNECWG
ncbi:hypothetical protein CK203_060220 [Vitis vinifera]|uniref:Endonuclease/exonuclease/phosphatase domain-containing protein n=1 Tax=Vitis vinifera TaxID=29760 RepID=A0A438FS37_VITVI|nr:hypothetical protein CK203_060220 [Vitis vinifera]